MDWIKHFGDFFTKRASELEAILDAGGCREGWVQGQMYLDRGKLQIRTNATPKKYDLFCADPPMVAEIKICGGDYALKTKDWILADFDKLARADRDYKRFMILIIDNRNPGTNLGRWLIGDRDFPGKSIDFGKPSDFVRVRI